MKTILITGASGMVGRNIQDNMPAKSYRLLTPSSKDLNLLDKPSVEACIKETKPDAIIHAAGQVGGIQANIADPVGFLSNNAVMGLNLFNAASENGIRYGINLASSCMYPRSARNPLCEDQVLAGELEPTNEGYALAKILVTRLCQYITNASNGQRQYLTLIPCNLYGPHDKFDPLNSHMIPAVIRKIHEAKQQNESLVDIWGDGEARREFMHAGDLASCIYFVLHKILSGENLPTVMNVGLGEDYSINEYYQSVAAVVGYSGGFSHDLSKPVGMQRKLIDSEKINSIGWKPLISLDDGIRDTYKFFLGR